MRPQTAEGNEQQPLEGEPRARVLVAGGSGLTGALAARLVWRHPRLELIAVSARSEAGTRLDRLHPRHRVPVTLEELDLSRLDDLDAAIVELEARGVRFAGEIIASEWYRYRGLHDPEGNLVYLTEPLLDRRSPPVPAPEDDG
jgi:hypothetical protein